MSLLPSISLPVVSAPQASAELPTRKLLKHLSGNDYTLEIDNSSLEHLMACDRKAQHALVHSKVLAGGRSALVYGSAIHDGLEKLYREDCRDIKLLYPVVAPHFEANPPPEGEWRTLEVCIDTLQKYLKQYPAEGFEVYRYKDSFAPDDVSFPAVELPFAIPLTVIPVNNKLAFTTETLVAGWEAQDPSEQNEIPYVENIHVVWTGKIDLIAEQDGRLGIIDHKTSSVVGDSYFKGFELSQQFMGYWWSAEKLLNRELSWAMINCIAGRKPTRTGTGLEFLRRYYSYRRDQIDNWPKSIIAMCEDLIHRLVSGFFPMKTLHCTNKFGLCPYHDVCTQKDEHQQTVLNSNLYTNSTWSPLN